MHDMHLHVQETEESDAAPYTRRRRKRRRDASEASATAAVEPGAVAGHLADQRGLLPIPCPQPVHPPEYLEGWQEEQSFTSEQLACIQQLDGVGLQGYQCPSHLRCTFRSKLNHPWLETRQGSSFSPGLVSPACSPGVYNLFGPCRSHKTVAMFTQLLMAREKQASLSLTEHIVTCMLAVNVELCPTISVRLIKLCCSRCLE